MNFLIVEDDNLQLSGLKATFTKTYPDITIFTASNYDDAISIIEKHRIGLFLLDINLENEKNGLDICEYLRNHVLHKDTPVIFITDITSPNLDVINRYHCSFYFSKPYSDSDILNAVGSVLYPPATDFSGIRLRDIQGIYFRLVFNELVYVNVEGHHKHIYTTNGDFVVTNPVFDSLTESGGIQLTRCHKSYFFNPAYAVSYDKVNSLLHVSGAEAVIPVGRKYKSAIDNIFS